MSPLYFANGGYLTQCKNCVNKYFAQLVEFFSGNEEKAMDRMAQIADWYYLDDIWVTTSKISSGQSRVGVYPSKMQLPQWTGRGTTYLDTIKERASAFITDYDEFDDMRESGDTGVTKAQLERWGLGFEESEYKQMDTHYRSLRELIDTNDIVQEKLAKDLCKIYIQQCRAFNSGDPDRIQKFTKLYQDTLKSANLRVKSGDMDTLTNDEMCWGNFIKQVEEHCPADIYQDKKLFADVDGIKDYLTRFVLRPVRNFFMGTNEMDEEFVIRTGEDGDES